MLPTPAVDRSTLDLIAELQSKNYRLDEMLTFYRQKYSLNNDAIVLKSLIWFEDTDLSDWPVMILEPKLAWAQVKKRLEKAVEGYLNS
ncbi:MAG: hypothetical protein WCK92_08370 [Bacteroidota bacterium]